MSQQQDMPPAPPEAKVIRLARLAARMMPAEAAEAVREAGGQISDTYWRDIERGHGGRRGRRVPARASDGLLAQMADAVGVTPDQLTKAGRRDAALILIELQRRERPQSRRSRAARAGAPVRAAPSPAPAASPDGPAAPSRIRRVMPGEGEPVPLLILEQFGDAAEPRRLLIAGRAEALARARDIDITDATPGSVLESTWVLWDDTGAAQLWDSLAALGYSLRAVTQNVALWQHLAAVRDQAAGRDAAGLPRGALPPGAGRP